jgi:hypothetical protein
VFFFLRYPLLFAISKEDPNIFNAVAYAIFSSSVICAIYSSIVISTLFLENKVDQFYMSKLFDSGTYGCIYYPGIDCSGNVLDNSMVSKIENDESAQHEIYMSNLVRKIKNYQEHFLPVEHHCNVTQNLPIHKCKALTRHSKFKILYIPFKKSHSNKLPFNILYHSLLTSIDLLVKHKIVHFDLNYKNIMISDKVYLLDFGLSISMKSIYKQLKTVFYTYHISYYLWPLEVHILCYLLNKGPITKSSLIEICGDFVKHHILLQKSSREFAIEYLDNSILYYSKLLTLSNQEIIHFCIQSWKTWDNYAVIIYLFNENYTIPPFFLKCIHYYPKERPSIAKCLATA